MTPNLTKLLEHSVMIRGKSVSDMHIDRCKDEIIMVMAEALSKHSCCPACEPCPGCKNHDALKKVEELSAKALEEVK